MHFLHYQLWARIKKESGEMKWKKKNIHSVLQLSIALYLRVSSPDCHWCCITAAFPVSVRGQRPFRRVQHHNSKVLLRSHFLYGTAHLRAL